MHLLLLFALTAVAPGADRSPSMCRGDAIVKRVSWENPGKLSVAQQATLTDVVMGRCFNRDESSELGEAVFDQLRKFGYERPYVQDPIVRVLDRIARPLPVAVTIDFVLEPSRQSSRKPK